MYLSPAMNHQISLFPLPEFEADFTSDDWETPDDIAQKMASLIQPLDRRILEPAAGTGQIAKFLPRNTFCCEIKSSRVQIGREKAPHCHWVQYDFLTLALGLSVLEQLGSPWQGCDLLVTNPPFSRCISFIEQGLKLLNRDNPKARLLYLLPREDLLTKQDSPLQHRLFAQLTNHSKRAVLFCQGKLEPIDFCSSVERGLAFLSLDCHVHHEHRILNRVAYIRDGKAFKGRQIYDAVFDIRPGKQAGAVSFL